MAGDKSGKEESKLPLRLIFLLFLIFTKSGLKEMSISKNLEINVA
jgi:hypothetical protein